MEILYFFSTVKSIRIFNHFSSSLQCFCQYQNKKVKENNSSSHRLELENKKAVRPRRVITSLQRRMRNKRVKCDVKCVSTEKIKLQDKTGVDRIWSWENWILNVIVTGSLEQSIAIMMIGNGWAAPTSIHIFLSVTKAAKGKTCDEKKKQLSWNSSRGWIDEIALTVIRLRRAEAATRSTLSMLNTRNSMWQNRWKLIGRLFAYIIQHSEQQLAEQRATAENEDFS